MNLKTIKLYLFLSCTLTPPLYGLDTVSIDETKPVLYYADSQTYDRELGILILKGHVEFDHEGTVLEADYVTYSESADLVTASGNVRIRQPNGDVSFAEYVELTGDLKEGLVLQIRALLEDDSKLAALEGRKFEDREELDQAVYTPCELCGDKPPTWQINARRAVKDEVNNDIHFYNSQLRILDVPVMPFPYMTQPLERRSGFLIPQPQYKSDLGFIAPVPYYIVLSEDKDLTLAPAYLTKQNLMLTGKYRQAFGNGVLKVEGSITDYKKSAKDKEAEKLHLYTIPTIRGHVFGEGVFNLTDVWRLKGEGGVVSDKTYFRKYGFSRWQSAAVFTSKATLEGFLTQRDYAAATVKYFQGLRDGDRQKNIPAALPFLEYSAYSDADPLGGRFTFDGNFLNLYRPEGINMQRGIGEIGWQRPWTIPSGQVFTVFASGRGDLYQVEDPFPFQKKGGGGRFFPQTGLDWRWPFITTCQQQSIIVQPLAQIIAAPRKAIGVAARRIPNEDSTDFEFNDINLFSSDRFPGYDVLDTGSRAVYGGQLLTTGNLFGDVELFLGQNYSFSKPNAQEKFQGIRNGFSDYVGRVQASPWSWLNLTYRFRLAEKSFKPLVSEVGGSLGPAIAKLSGTYVFISKNAGTIDKKDFKQLNITFSSQFTKYLTFTATLLQNLRKKQDGGGVLSRGFGLMYRDDCFTLGAAVQRQYFVARDLKPATLFIVTLGFKNVGDFPLSYNLDKGLFGNENSQQNSLAP
ncbi:MAG: LPS-assembly protein LptD [Proteobacteria bacterium]|nr:LPS-assembly protein LptD [Pseudomonadota bacterium]